MKDYPNCALCRWALLQDEKMYGAGDQIHTEKIIKCSAIGYQRVAHVYGENYCKKLYEIVINIQGNK